MALEEDQLPQPPSNEAEFPALQPDVPIVAVDPENPGKPPVETPNPFESAPTNPFEDVPASGEAQPNKQVATPIRTAVASLAMLSEQAPQITTENALARAIRENADIASRQIEVGNEEVLRNQAAIRRIQERSSTLRQIQVNPIIPTEVQAQISQTYQENISQRLDEARRIATEDEAVDNIRTLLMAGRETEARMAMNALNPARNSSAAVIRDGILKRMVMSQVLERANVDVENEGWIHWLLSGLISVPEALLGGDIAWRGGNVNEGQGGYHSPGFLSQIWAPGSDMANQIEAVQGMSAAELQQNLPSLIENWRYNSSNLWLTHDPGRFREIVREFEQGLSPDEIASANFWAKVDILSLVPWGTATRLFSGTRQLMTVGARRAAAGRVADAVDSTIAQGAEHTVARTGVDAVEVEDNALPRIINPHRTEVDDRVSLSANVNSALDEAHTLVNDMVGDPIMTHTDDVRTTNARVTNQAEFDNIIEANRRILQDQVGATIHDLDVVPIDLPDGTRVFRLEAVVGRNGEEGFATIPEAENFASSRGLYTDPSVIESRAVPTTEVVQPVRARKALGPANITEPRGDYAKVDLGDRIAANDLAADLLPGGQQSLDELTKVFQEDWAGLSEIEKARPGAKQKLWDEILTANDEIVGHDLNDAQIAAVRKAVTNPNNPQTAIRAGRTGIGREQVAANDVNVVKDVSEQYFVKVSMDIRETGLYTPGLNPPRTGIIARFVSNASRLLDRRLFEKALVADAKRNKMYKLMEKRLRDAYTGLPKKDRATLSQILMKGDNLARWFTDEEFSTIFERATGRVPSDKVIAAHHEYRLINDAEHILRESDIYRSKVIRGFRSTKFNIDGDAFDIDAFVDHAPSSVSHARTYNITDKIHYTRGSPLTPQRLEELRGQGYIHIRTEQPIKLRDGTTVNEFIGKRADIEVQDIRRQQLAYRAGGHRLYADKYFVKQARTGRQPDTGTEFSLNPSVFVTAPNIRDARVWADAMESARVAVKEDGAGAAHLDEHVFLQRKGLPTGEQFLADVEAGKISLDHPFEALFDREQPSFYRHKEDISNFLDEDEVGFNGFYRTNGRMYYSPKGEQLRDYAGELAPTLDPFEAQAKALFNVSNMSSFSDFKVSAIDRWVSTYKRDLNIRDLPEDQAASPASIFNSATVKRDTPIPIRNAIEAQRDAIKRILGFESNLERGYRYWLRSTAEWVVGDSDSALRKSLSQGVYWLADKNPITFLRGMAFDLKLGFFNIGQFFIQTSTMWSALSLSPRVGARAMASVMPIRAYFLSKGSENVLDTLVKRGVHRLAGFDSAEEFKNYVRWARTSGFFDLGDTHSLVQNAGPARTFGSIRGGAERVRDTGRMFFYEAEVWNRLVATRIAYDEAVKRFGSVALGNLEHREFIMGRAEANSFNMSNVSRAWWQTGLTSIPTQFWAYNVRMMEAMLGGQFTKAQKVRLAAMQFGLAGTGGIPILAGIVEYRNMQNGGAPSMQVDEQRLAATLQRGVFDRLVYEIYGADVMIGERFGTGEWSTDLVRDLFGYSKYQNRTAAQMLGGATYSIMGTTLQTAVDFTRYWTSHEAGTEDVNMAGDQIIQMFRQFSTVNNATKALMAHQYGIYMSTRGATQITDLPRQDAIFIALGFRPGEMADVEAMMGHSEARQQVVNDYATQANNLLRDAINRPDVAAENAQRVNLLINLAPPEMRHDILARIHASRDPSIYSRLLRQRDMRNALDATAIETERLNDNGSANGPASDGGQGTGNPPASPNNINF